MAIVLNNTARLFAFPQGRGDERRVLKLLPNVETKIENDDFKIISETETFKFRIENGEFQVLKSFSGKRPFSEDAESKEFQQPAPKAKAATKTANKPAANKTIPSSDD